MTSMSDVAVSEAGAAAVDLAEQMAREIAQRAEDVGEHLGAEPVGDVTVVHRFACQNPGYVGWAWAVALTSVPGEPTTVDEAWLEPGEGALLAPAWRPWSERVQPGDLGAGDLYPTAADDPRLTAGFTAEDDLDGVVADQPLHPLQWELGLGRLRVLSALGREEAADRWEAGEGGPDSAVSRAAADRCVTCGWLMPLGGSLGQAFGVCAQSMSPSDGRVVSLLHGCGAHSEVVAEPSAAEVVEVVLDEVGFDTVDIADESADDADSAESAEDSDAAAGELVSEEDEIELVVTQEDEHEAGEPQEAEEA